jgi:hypothetical protein
MIPLVFLRFKPLPLPDMPDEIGTPPSHPLEVIPALPTRIRNSPLKAFKYRAGMLGEVGYVHTVIDHDTSMLVTYELLL